MDAGARGGDRTVTQHMEDNALPGVVVGVWVPGEDEYVVAKGLANLETGRKRDLDAPFRIASITKTFVATAVLQLVDEGKLSKSDTLSRWYPDFPNAERITVDDLLRMRSGLVDGVIEGSDDEFAWEAYKKNRLADLTIRDEIESSVSISAQRGYPPDQRTEYTNVNYLLLGEIVEKESGKDLGTYITRNILEPLDMKNTIYPIEANLPGDLHGYHAEIASVELVDTTIINPAPLGGGDDLGYLGPEDLGQSRMHWQAARS